MKVEWGLLEKKKRTSRKGQEETREGNRGVNVIKVYYIDV
jgi:hypothetical protein